MPEIPDLEAIRGFFNQRLSGLTVTRTELRFPWLVRSADGLDSVEGCSFGEVTRYGKFLLFPIDDGRLMVVNGMLTGRFTWSAAGERRRPGTCITLAFSSDEELRYSDARRMGRWYIVPADELAGVPQFGSLGADALSVDEETFVTELRRRHGQLKNTITNQQFIAGIGNAYSDEVLWAAGLHPHRRGATLDDEDRRRLYHAMQETFAWALPILREQVSERLYQRNEEWREHLRVHRKAGEPCPHCGSELRGQTRGGSETNYCLSCQPLF